MGTFPPGRHRWSMDFYYPNRTNDFWYAMGLIFFNNRYEFLRDDQKSFNVDSIISFLNNKKIALNDTAGKVCRLKGNASDKFLQIIEPAPIFDLLERMPSCVALATTGEKAAGIIAQLTNTKIPKIGCSVKFEIGSRVIEIWRMPSTSRAYPLALDKKAGFYAEMFRSIGIL
ncbi:MAG: uracil-DNA glycosylase family protein [Candidatus Amulumruptor caecigallinarius]|nr:uracil-DNA glycosylase family protein [Candidatus Amulumruptor caecigallinarius]